MRNEVSSVYLHKLWCVCKVCKILMENCLSFGHENIWRKGGRVPTFLKFGAVNNVWSALYTEHFSP